MLIWHYRGVRGPADEQVKIRGFRIELGDVARPSSTLRSGRPPVVSDLSRGWARVCGRDTRRAATTRRCRRRSDRSAWVVAALPEYMLPAACCAGDSDHRAWQPTAPRCRNRRRVGHQFRAATERRLPKSCSGELLGRDRVGAGDSFFSTSRSLLLATKLAAAVRNAPGVDVGVREIF